MRLIGVAGRRIRRRRLGRWAARARAWRPGLRAWILAGSAVIVIGLAVAVAWIAADNLRGLARQAARQHAEAIVRGYIDPILGAKSLDLDADPDTVVARQLERLAAGADIERISIWTRDGRVMYSTDPLLRDQRLGIDATLSATFGGVTNVAGGAGGTDASGLPAHVTAIFVPIRGSTDGSPIGVFEMHLDSGPVEAQVATGQQAVFAISLAAGAVLWLMLWTGFSGASRLLAVKNRRLTAMNAKLNDLAGDLRQREARFRSLVQNSSDVVVVLTFDGSVIYESDAVRPVLGHEPSQGSGETFAERVHADDLHTLRTLFDELATRPGSHRTCELRLRHADGTWRWVEIIGQNRCGDPAVGGVVLNYRDVTERKRLEDQLQHEAFHDPLTGLANRALFRDRVEHAMARRGRQPARSPAVLFIDLDDFKLVNDSLGHDAGDQLLTAVAERLRGCLRREDTAARLGGDEFAILLEEAGEPMAAELANRILESLGQPFVLQARQLFVQASIGIVVAGSSDADDALTDHLLRNADAAMYAAKSTGKARHVFYEAGMHARAMERLELRERLEAAIAARDLVVHYQPVVDLLSGDTVGAEALIRWRQPDGRMAPPAEFVPLAEESGLILDLGRYVLDEACEEAAVWLARAPGRVLTVAVNASSRQLREPGFAGSVIETLSRTRLPAANLVLELTESALLDEGESTLACLAALKEVGVRLALDDFGTGYSSLSHLRRFPIDILKIDRSFVADVDAAGDGERALVQSIVRLARSLDLEIVAEGIERPTQLSRLRALGVQLGQGYLFSSALDGADFAAQLDGASQRAG
jgi:diguanylate cyclase (GGDEF)-like protein/PAS domain S-box-containing protein